MAGEIGAGGQFELSLEPSFESSHLSLNPAKRSVDVQSHSSRLMSWGPSLRLHDVEQRDEGMGVGTNAGRSGASDEGVLVGVLDDIASVHDSDDQGSIDHSQQYDVDVIPIVDDQPRLDFPWECRRHERSEVRLDRLLQILIQAWKLPLCLALPKALKAFACHRC